MNNLLTLLISLMMFGCASSKMTQEHLSMATLWAQTSGEARALSYQAFNIAREKLDMDLRKKSKRKRAIVVDVDETIVDNSPFQAQGIIDNTGYPTGWDEWIQLADAKALPGAVEFLRYAAKRGVEVFYITNRKVKGFEATYRNLLKLGAPVKRQNMLLRDKIKSKGPRREHVLKNYRIVLFMGDNLGDFADVFENKSLKDRNGQVTAMKSEFGRRFIVLPNAMYGDWEGAVYNGNFKLSPEDKMKVRHQNLNTIR